MDQGLSSPVESSSAAPVAVTAATSPQQHRDDAAGDLGTSATPLPPQVPVDPPPPPPPPPSTCDTATNASAWYQVHATLLEAVLRAHQSVRAQEAQRRFWLEEVCGNLNDHGKLLAGSVWKRPLPVTSANTAPAGHAAHSRKSQASASTSTKHKRKVKDTSSCPAGDKPPTKKSRTKKKQTTEASPEKAPTASNSSPTQPPHKPSLAGKRTNPPQEDTAEASPQSRSQPQSTLVPPPHPPVGGMSVPPASTVSIRTGPTIYGHPPSSASLRGPPPTHLANYGGPSPAAALASIPQQQQQQQWSSSSQSSNLQLMAAVAFGQSRNTPPSSLFYPSMPPTAPPSHVAGHVPNPHHAYPPPPRNYTSLQDLEQSAMEEDSDEENHHTF